MGVTECKAICEIGDFGAHAMMKKFAIPIWIRPAK